MEKKRSSQPILTDDQSESSTKDLDSQVSRTYKMPGSDKQPKQKGKDKGDMKGNKDKQW